MTKKISPQDIFNVAWQAFVVEGKPAAIHNGICKYRIKDDDGTERRCAVGLALSSEQIDELEAFYDEGKSLRQLIECKDWFECDYPKGPMQFIQSELHDRLAKYLGNPAFASYIKNTYLIFAETWNLQVPVG